MCLRASRFVLPVTYVTAALSGLSFLYYETPSCLTATSECTSDTLPFDDIAFLLIPLTSGSAVHYSMTDGAYRASLGMG